MGCAGCQAARSPHRRLHRACSSSREDGTPRGQSGPRAHTGTCRAPAHPAVVCRAGITYMDLGDSRRTFWTYCPRLRGHVTGTPLVASQHQTARKEDKGEESPERACVSLVLSEPPSAKGAAMSEGIHAGGCGTAHTPNTASQPAHTALHMTHLVSFSLNPNLSVSQSVLPAGTEDAQLSRWSDLRKAHGPLPVLAL